MVKSVTMVMNHKILYRGTEQLVQTSGIKKRIGKRNNKITILLTYSKLKSKFINQ